MTYARLQPRLKPYTLNGQRWENTISGSSTTGGRSGSLILAAMIFAGASALCGLTPSGGIAETWLVAFRAVQGLGWAIMFPAAIAIVVETFDLRSRGRALALFFGIAGALTAIGPIAGGYLLEWTWRGIFWINIPVALIALALIAISKPATEHRPAPMDYRGLALIVVGVGLSVFGLQQLRHPVRIRTPISPRPGNRPAGYDGPVAKSPSASRPPSSGSSSSLSPGESADSRGSGAVGSTCSE